VTAPGSKLGAVFRAESCPFGKGPQLRGKISLVKHHGRWVGVIRAGREVSRTSSSRFLVFGWCLNHIDDLVQRKQWDARQTVVVTDEGGRTPQLLRHNG